MKKSLLALVALAATLTSHAGPTFDSTTGVLTMTDVTIDGKRFFDNLNLKLNPSNGTFELISAKEKNPAISTTPLQTYSANNITVDFLGCTRTGSTQISCYVNVTNFNNDNDIKIHTGNSYTDRTINGKYEYTVLYDNLGAAYRGSVNVSGTNYTSEFTKRFLQGVPVQAAYTFISIDSRATSISGFTPAFTYGTASFMATFKNISF